MSSGAAAGRLGSYSSRADVDTIEELSKRLTADLRKHIRALVRRSTPFCPPSFSVGAHVSLPQGPCDVLSERWIEVGDCLGRVASISQMVRENFITAGCCFLRRVC